ncbi:class I SAM-dependent methyltransferase [Cohnella abietis]|uniref:Methyltransferase type 11 domain-containing protein n=1 Tax=Cohnella abietis TaxID=2507935 RepID=A0A3T1DDX6_9BACL|nr:class I SAM-dependent methyltransferase [Cohnella abietis]BBI36178.1 hypothetical protein KCTCHS21_55770 [Cohnella abietis]
MEDIKEVEINKCWCGNEELEVFNDKYKKCMSCFTLINTPRQITSFYEVENENDDDAFYGKNYWMGHQTDDLGHPSIFQRSRKDLGERCLYWLQAVLKYKLPPGDSLEVGSGPGAFVQMMKSVGYDAQGLELSPWVAKYGSKTHGVKIINSRIEDVSDGIDAKDVIAMMDVLEHFTDPVETMSHVVRVLKDDGLLVIQTPCYNHMSYQEMLDANDPFLIQLKDQEHLFLFSKEAIAILLKQLDIRNIEFLDPLFPYDMFVMASANSLQALETDRITEFMEAKPDTRLILAMLDLFNEHRRVLAEAEERLKNNQIMERLLKVSEQDRTHRLESIQTLERMLGESEQDRAARLESIQTLERLLRESEQDRHARLETINSLEALVSEKTGGVKK